jgi:CBS domain-containing protein
MDLRKSLDESVSKFMSTDFVSVPDSTTVEEAARAMERSGSTEAIVTRAGDAVGIFTERDILYKVVAAGRVPSSIKVQVIMTAPVQTIESTAKSGDAIAKMSKLGIRRLGVTKNGKMVGLVTQKSVVSARLEDQIVLPELTSPERLVCPYCGSDLKDGRELSKHIDDVHIGRGLLQGDLSKW